MIVRNSFMLLEQLSRLEERLREWESWARAQGLEVDSDLLLRLITQEFHTRTSSATPPLTSQQRFPRMGVPTSN